MGRKRKQQDNDRLPPCRICNGPAAGFHYGVNTCDACKGFFHRSLTAHVHYKCRYSQKCETDYWNEQFCHWCRYQKCLRMGMSKAAIKTGRYSTSKRTNDICEVKKRKSLQSERNPRRGKNNVHKVSVNENQPQVHQSPSNSSSDVLNDCMMGQENDEYSLHSENNKNNTFDFALETLQAESKSPPDHVRLREGSSTGNTPSSSCHSAEEDYLISAPSSTSPSCQEDASTPEMEADFYCTSPDVSALFDGTSLDEEKERCLGELYGNKEATIKELKEGFLEFITPMFFSETDEQIEQMQKEHVESCRLRREMFGRLRLVTCSEFEDVYVNTGIDVDGRIQMLQRFSNSVEEMTKATVKFAKLIPGFQQLTLGEKINLIKYSRYDFVCFVASKFANVELGIFPYDKTTARWKCHYEYSDLPVSPIVDDYMKILKRLKKLKLTEEERVLVSVIILMDPDRDSKTHSTAVNQIHWKVVECLLHQLSLRMAKPMNHFTKIVSYFTEMKDVLKKIISHERGNNSVLMKYVNFEEKPLFKEVMSGILFDSDGKV